jgi:DNA-binding response OmpR family regulator
VVDDEPDMVVSYERLLRRRGFHVISAGTLREGMELVRRLPLALLVCDVRLPDGDGIDVVRAAKTLDPRPPTVVVTGYGSSPGRQIALAAGASAYLTKPVTVAGFDAAITAALAEAPSRFAAREDGSGE